MILKTFSERKGEHVHVHVFMGPNTDHLASCGVLTFNVGEWQSFGAALGLGATQMHGNLKVIQVGGEQVVATPERD